MALVQVDAPTPHHIGVFLPGRPKTAERYWTEMDTKHRGKFEVTEEVRAFYDENASGGQKSDSDRTITLRLEGTTESISMGGKVSTKVLEVRELLAHMLGLDMERIQIKRKFVSGARVQKDGEEIASHAIVSGVRSFKRPQRQYEHPLLVIGGGLGGMQTIIDLLDRGRKNIICMEKHSDFGGHSWISVANRFTKLQTERGTYHVDYIKPEAPVPRSFGDMIYKTWPSRDDLLRMFRESAKANGLYEKAMFNTVVEKVTPKPGFYAIQHCPANDPDGDASLLQVSAVLAWPGNLVDHVQIEFPGEAEFGGYIEYASFDAMDYTKCEGKLVVLYGHGAFTIENVRTLVEHKCKKVIVMCRRRNICGMKMVSWMVGQAETPVPGHIMLDAMQKMYDLVGFDVWSAHSVQTDQHRSYAQISQKTVFGVTDVYFLAEYFGLMEVVVDEIKRLTYHTAHTKRMKTIDCEVIIKAVGTAPSFKVDKFLGIKELVGIWVNGDPLRPVSCNGMFVQAKNFGSFSSGPGFAPMIKIMNWFIDHPEDWQAVEKQLPRNQPSDRPAYVPGATYFLPMTMALTQALPALAMEIYHMDNLKAKKQRESHPLREFLGECKAEWENYTKFFREHNLVDDRPDPPYPYTIENMTELMERSDAFFKNKGSHVKKEAIESTHHSPNADRTVSLEIEGTEETMTIPAKGNTKVQEVRTFLAGMLGVQVDMITIKQRGPHGLRVQSPTEDVADTAIVSGIHSFKRSPKQYVHPILVIGGGLGGLQTMVDLLDRGRTNFICVEKHADYGGHSWIGVANRFTKLQTEKGTYHVDYFRPDSPVPHKFGDMTYKTWPTRDEIIRMFRESAKSHGLYEKAMFKTEVMSVLPKSGYYAVQHRPADRPNDSLSTLQVSAVMSWPGNLVHPVKIDFPGEEEFGGYIEYSSFDLIDYPRCERKVCILYGHGAFTIENVRTLVEHRCKKVYVMCRKRNISGMKMISWLVHQSETPVPGHVVLDAMQKMYDLVGWDVWSAHSIQTDKTRSFAHINQKTVFGVTDIYFLAGYFGLMEVVVDEIQRLSHHKAHTKKGATIDCEIIVKAVGTAPDFETDKVLGIKELVGLWINGDPLRPVACNGMFVQARNFGSFSSPPGFAPIVKMMNWFIDFPEDFQVVEKALPRNQAGERPAYVPGATFFLPMTIALSTHLPMLALELQAMDAVKAKKTREAHPLHQYLGECKAEWENYIKGFREAGMVDDRPDPPYPYTEENMGEFIRRSDDYARSKAPAHAKDGGNSHATHSPDADRTVTLEIEGTGESMTIPAKGNTKVQDVKNFLAGMLRVEPEVIIIKQQDSHGQRVQSPSEVVADVVKVGGIYSFKRSPKEYVHPILVIGGGLGGLQTMVDLQDRGRTNFLCVEKHADYGGHSWIGVANRFTKLQTEKGTYHVDYFRPDSAVPHKFGDMAYKTWPTRDEILRMFRESAKSHGLYEKAMFRTEVVSVVPKSGYYAVQHRPADRPSDPLSTLQVSAVMAWPGNLVHPVKIDFPGEEEFGGYIEYSSFDLIDYTKCERKVCILYGHGAFTIENVRTLVEHRCKKVYVMCRKRNISGMKVISWLVHQAEAPVPGHIVLDAMQKMYDLVGWDVWSAHSIQTDKTRSFAHINQKTVFGVTDIYFLAGYFGLMEVVIDEIQRLSHHKAHTKKGATIDCEIVIKAVGTASDFETDNVLGIKELVGLWINGDPLRPVACNGMFVQARNFGSFSSPPGFAPIVKMMNWFIDFPEDFKVVEAALPKNLAGERPAYVPGATFFLPMTIALSTHLPMLALELQAMDAIKARKTREAHPLREYLAECKAEWEGYIKQFRAANMVDDRPDPPYPYTEENVSDIIRRCDEYHHSQMARGKKI